MMIEDNGVGFDMANQDILFPSEWGRRLGVAGMQERAALVGGRLTIDFAPGQGTRVLLVIPFVWE